MPQTENPYLVVLGNGDEAEATTLEGAVLAARTLWDEACWRDARPAAHIYLATDNTLRHLATITDRRQLSC